MSNKDESLAFIAGFVIGGLVGAATALLLAPQSGVETRAQIREKGIELKGRAEDIAEETRRRVEEVSAEPNTSHTIFRSKIEIILSEDFCNLFSCQHY